MQTTNLTIRCDAGPFVLFAKLFERAIEGFRGPVGRLKLPLKLARGESDATRTGEVTVRLYPSDALLRFASALLARSSVQ